MAIQKLNEYLGVPLDDFVEKGIFNPFVGLDAHFFLDPALLRDTNIPEFKDSHKKIVAHFVKVLRLIKASKSTSDIAWREACKQLTFPETKGVSIGYGQNRGDGSAIGPELAVEIALTAREIIALGVDDPTIFELIPLFQGNIGPDRLSDMAIHIIKEDIFAYTSRVVKELQIKAEYLVPFIAEDKTILALIKNPNPKKKRPIILLPEALLQDLPLVLDRDDISEAARFNQLLREKVSRFILGDAAGSFKDVTKEQFKEVLLENKKDMQDLVGAYNATPAKSYNFEEDPSGQLNWYEKGREFAEKNPFEITLKTPKTVEQVNEIVRQIIEQFRRNVEFNGLNELLYKEPLSAHKPKNERAAQRIFFSVADTYCKANNVVLAREPNAGNGPVDFKISEDYKTQVLVEIKLSSGKVRKGYEKQLPEYEKNENSQYSFLVILKVGKTAKAAEEVKEESDLARDEKKHIPEVLIVDAFPRPSASK